jgi:hypothetical protein
MRVNVEYNLLLRISGESSRRCDFRSSMATMNIICIVSRFGCSGADNIPMKQNRDARK